MAGASASGRSSLRGSPPTRGSRTGDGPPMRIALGCGTRRAPVNGDVRSRRVWACSDEPSVPRAACALSFCGDGTRIAGTRLADMGVCAGAFRGVSTSTRASFCSSVCVDDTAVGDGDPALGANDPAPGTLGGDEKTSAAAGTCDTGELGAPAGAPAGDAASLLLGEKGRSNLDAAHSCSSDGTKSCLAGFSAGLEPRDAGLTLEMSPRASRSTARRSARSPSGVAARAMPGDSGASSLSSSSSVASCMAYQSSTWRRSSAVGVPKKMVGDSGACGAGEPGAGAARWRGGRGSVAGHGSAAWRSTRRGDPGLHPTHPRGDDVQERLRGLRGGVAGSQAPVARIAAVV